MSNSNKSADSMEKDSVNWPARIWRLMVSLIPFVLLFYYFTYEPVVEEPAPGPPAVVSDSIVADSLR